MSEFIILRELHNSTSMVLGLFFRHPLTYYYPNILDLLAGMIQEASRGTLRKGVGCKLLINFPYWFLKEKVNFFFFFW